MKLIPRLPGGMLKTACRVTIIFASCLIALAARLEAVEVETYFQTDPQFKQASVVSDFSPRLKTLWLAALARPEIELQRQAANAIARAHQLGMPGLKDAAPQLLSILNTSQSPLIIKLAAARALVALDARDAAPELMRHALADGWEMAQWVEPVLASWDHAPMREVWLRRLQSPTASGRSLVLAIRAAEKTQLTAAVPRLRQIALNPTAGPEVRLPAAQALAKLQPQGLEETAGKLVAGAASSRRIDQLVAATLLVHHSGRPAESLLTQLAAEAEPAVAAIALQRLLELNPSLLAPHNRHILVSPDANVRRLATLIFREQKTAAAVSLLGLLLDDVDPKVRKSAQESLISLADIPDLKVPVQETAMQALALDQPRGLEQATLIVGAIAYRPAADRLLQLLRHQVPAVSITAAWGLRRLLVPETAEPIFAKVRADTEQSLIPLPLGTNVDRPAIETMYRQQQHLLETLALLRYRPAESLLLLYFPTPPLRDPPPDIRLDTVWIPELRIRAIWALGLIFENDPQANVVASLSERLRTPDSEHLRGITAISLGRMHATSALEQLRSHFQLHDSYSELRFGCAWAVARITGEPIPELPLKPQHRAHPGWFLEPLE